MHLRCKTLKTLQVHIAERHLVPKLLEEHGLSAQQLAFPRQALRVVACGYTREAGVRSLSRWESNLSSVIACSASLYFSSFSFLSCKNCTEGCCIGE